MKVMAWYRVNAKPETLFKEIPDLPSGWFLDEKDRNLFAHFLISSFSFSFPRPSDMSNGAATYTPPQPGSKIIIVGGGAFGLSTAYALALKNKYDVWVYDRQTIPAPDAASTGIYLLLCT